jgi:hypothetical protein
MFKPGLYKSKDGTSELCIGKVRLTTDPFTPPTPDCPYCGKEMELQGIERQVKKRWKKKGMTSEKQLKKTDHPLFLCPDIECGGIQIVEKVIIGNADGKIKQINEVFLVEE